MFHFNIIFRARFRLDIFFQKTVELSVSHSFHLFNLILRYNIKVQGSNLKIYIFWRSHFKKLTKDYLFWPGVCFPYPPLTWDTCEPMALCAALHVMHITTPRLRLTHSGPGAPQSTHLVLPSPGSSTRLTSPACSGPWGQNNLHLMSVLTCEMCIPVPVGYFLSRLLLMSSRMLDPLHCCKKISIVAGQGSLLQTDFFRLDVSPHTCHQQIISLWQFSDLLTLRPSHRGIRCMKGSKSGPRHATDTRTWRTSHNSSSVTTFSRDDLPSQVLSCLCQRPHFSKRIVLKC